MNVAAPWGLTEGYFLGICAIAAIALIWCVVAITIAWGERGVARAGARRVEAELQRERLFRERDRIAGSQEEAARRARFAIGVPAYEYEMTKERSPDDRPADPETPA